MSLETLRLEHLPSDHEILLGFYRNVQNASFLHEQLLARNNQFEYAFVDASVVLSRLHVLSAVFKAVTTAITGALKTPNVHSEIVASMTPSNNIAEAYRRFGVSPATTDLVVIKVLSPTTISDSLELSREAVQKHLLENVQGEAVSLTDEALVHVTEITKLRKYYKLNGLQNLDGIKDEHMRRREFESLILSGMALRGV